MKNLKRFNLDFKLAYEYVYNNLLDTNMLSTLLLKLIDFKNGDFFTLLPNNTDLKKINEFDHGGIATGVRKIIRSKVYDSLSSNDRISCIFDNITANFVSDNKEELFLSCGLFFKNEIYYLINQETDSLQLVDKCFYASDAIWHSLCIFSEINLINKNNNSLSFKEMENICLSAQLIIIGAYDGEGYIFWEKKPNKFWKE